MKIIVHLINQLKAPSNIPFMGLLFLTGGIVLMIFNIWIMKSALPNYVKTNKSQICYNFCNIKP